MKSMFTLEDEWHCESEEFAAFELALFEIRRRTQMPWDKAPIQAPCNAWRTCGRKYVIREFDTSTMPWTFTKSTPIVEIDAKGVRWEPEFEPRK